MAKTLHSCATTCKYLFHLFDLEFLFLFHLSYRWPLVRTRKYCAPTLHPPLEHLVKLLRGRPIPLPLLYPSQISVRLRCNLAYVIRRPLVSRYQLLPGILLSTPCHSRHLMTRMVWHRRTEWDFQVVLRFLAAILSSAPLLVPVIMKSCERRSGDAFGAELVRSCF